MNRNRFVPRIVGTSEGPQRVEEGDQEALTLATILASHCSAEFLERLLAHKLALDEFGGQIFISAGRQKFDGDRPVEHSEPGAYETIGYVFSYNKRSQIKGQVAEPDEEVTQAAPTAVANGNGKIDSRVTEDEAELEFKREGEPAS